VDLHLRFSTALLGLAVLVEFRIDLSGADTGVGIRDERLRSTGLRDFDLNGQLTLAGQSKPVSAKLRIGRMGAETVLASTRRPIVVNAADFGLRPGVEAMRDAMGLGFLSSSAPVSFALLLREQR
jgi:polyisoprenoid-binding protein YceI